MRLAMLGVNLLLASFAYWGGQIDTPIDPIHAMWAICAVNAIVIWFLDRD